MTSTAGKAWQRGALEKSSSILIPVIDRGAARKGGRTRGRGGDGEPRGCFRLKVHVPQYPNIDGILKSCNCPKSITTSKKALGRNGGRAFGRGLLEEGVKSKRPALTTSGTRVPHRRSKIRGIRFTAGFGRGRDTCPFIRELSQPGSDIVGVKNQSRGRTSKDLAESRLGPRAKESFSRMFSAGYPPGPGQQDRAVVYNQDQAAVSFFASPPAAGEPRPSPLDRDALLLPRARAPAQDPAVTSN
ncbi:hypothetical protein KM043_017239 [Ampulex compressa]|nr:hypothetical protein KM043_017239 [Ampulex compressa]